MITMLLILIDGYMRAFGYEPFIKDLLVMGFSAFLECTVIDIPIGAIIMWRTTLKRNLK